MAPLLRCCGRCFIRRVLNILRILAQTMIHIRWLKLLQYFELELNKNKMVPLLPVVTYRKHNNPNVRSHWSVAFTSPVENMTGKFGAKQLGKAFKRPNYPAGWKASKRSLRKSMPTQHNNFSGTYICTPAQMTLIQRWNDVTADQDVFRSLDLEKGLKMHIGSTLLCDVETTITVTKTTLIQRGNNVNW